MADKKNIRFIRKNGRIIPIKIKVTKDPHRRKKGAALSATGAVISFFGGRQAGKRVKAAKQARQAKSAVRGSMDIAAKLNPKMAKKFRSVNTKFAAKQQAIFNRKIKSAKRLKFASVGIGSLLIGAGLSQVLRNKDDSVAEEVAKDLAATSAAGVVGLGISSKQSGRLSGSLTKALKKVGKKVIFRK